jgi:hypothetical protein
MDRRWAITKIDAEAAAVEAEVWRLDEGEKCFDTTIRAKVDPDGGVSIVRVNPPEIDNDHSAVLERWMLLLEKQFLAYRCRDVDGLANLLTQKGYTKTFNKLKQ